MKLTLSALLFSLLFFSLSACEEEPEIIDEELYKTLITELAIVNQMDEELLSDKTLEEKREEVFDHYGVSRELFDLSHDIYQSDIDAQMERIKDVQDRLRTERDSVQAAERRHREENRIDPDSIRKQIRDRHSEL